MLSAGDKVPKFSLESDSVGRIASTEFGDAPVVVYFYPRDSTPGCTREAQAFSASLAKFRKLGAEVYGVSKDSLESHARFRAKLGLTVPLLSDPGLDVHRAFGAYGEKVMYGKKVMGVLRSTFVLHKGRVAVAYPKVRVDGHEQEVLEAVRTLLGTPAKAGPAAKRSPPKGATAKKPTAKSATTATKVAKASPARSTTKK